MGQVYVFIAVKKGSVSFMHIQYFLIFDNIMHMQQLRGLNVVSVTNVCVGLGASFGN